MTFIQFIFYAFASIAVSAAVMVVVSSNPVRGALCLVLTFFATAGVWMLLQAEFLSLILVLVYVGAVMTLFLFVVMMLSVDKMKLREGFVRYLPFAILLVLMVTGLSFMALTPQHFGVSASPVPSLKPASYNNTQMLGMVLYTEYVYPFEIAGVMLLAAIIAAISLTHRKPKNRKIQNPEQQVAVQRKDRIHLVKLAAEKKISSNRGDI